MSDWEPSSDGGTIWTDSRVQELIDEQKHDDESPNQFLKRVLGDEEDRREVDQERIREIANEEAWDVVEEAKRRR